MLRLKSLSLAHALDVLEAAASFETSPDAWLGALFEQTERLFGHPHCMFASYVRRLDDGQLILMARRGINVPPMVDALQDYQFKHFPQTADPYYFDRKHVTLLSEVVKTRPDAKPQIHEPYLKMMQCADVVGFRAHVNARDALMIACTEPETIELPGRLRVVLERVATHVEAGLAVRLGSANVVAELRPDGRLLDARGQASAPLARKQLQDHARGIESVRARRRRNDEEALEAWPALVSGRFAFVEEQRAGTRRYLVVQRPAHQWQHTRFSAVQAATVELASRGLSSKLVAYALGIPERAVSRNLGEAALRVGCANRAQLIGLATSALATRTSLMPHITESEREVLALVRTGQSNREIAEARGTSERTVANQVASLLRKTGLPSRRALCTFAGD